MISDASEAAIDQIVASCNGDIRGALKALLLVNEQLEAELAQFYAAVGLDGTWPRGSNAAALEPFLRVASSGLNRLFRPLSCGRSLPVGHAAMVERASLASSSDLYGPFPNEMFPPTWAVDDGIARDDLAFAGRAVADHPIATLRESDGSGRDDHRAGQQQ